MIVARVVFRLQIVADTTNSVLAIYRIPVRMENFDLGSDRPSSLERPFDNCTRVFGW